MFGIVIPAAAAAAEVAAFMSGIPPGGIPGIPPGGIPGILGIFIIVA